VQHVFARAGRYEVHGFDGQQLTDVVSVEVEPYASHRSVVRGASWVLAAKSFETVGTLADALERLTSARRANAILEQSPLIGLALQGVGEKASALDPTEGLTLASYGSVLLTIVGCADEAGALLRAREALAEAGWLQADGIFHRDDVLLRLSAQRGHLFATSGASLDEVDALLKQLGDDGGLAREVPAAAWAAISGAPLVVWARAQEMLAEAVLLGIGFQADVLDIDGYVLASAPLWKSSDTGSVRFLSGAPEGPIAALSLDVPTATMLDVLLGGITTHRRMGFEARWQREWGVSAAQAAEAIDGLEAAAYVDARGFYRSVIEREGRPKPRGTVLLQAAHHNRKVLERTLRAFFAELKLEGMASLSETALALFRGRVDGQTFELALSADALFGKAGTALDSAGTDVRSVLASRLPGSFEPGHLSAFVDVERFKEDLKTPILVPGIDPRQVVTAQAFTTTFLQQLTALKWAVIDVSPHPLGARLRARVASAPKEKP
jgi:hypothetical protein